MIIVPSWLESYFPKIKGGQVGTLVSDMVVKVTFYKIHAVFPLVYNEADLISSWKGEFLVI